MQRKGFLAPAVQREAHSTAETTKKLERGGAYITEQPPFFRRTGV